MIYLPTQYLLRFCETHVPSCSVICHLHLKSKNLMLRNLQTEFRHMLNFKPTFDLDTVFLTGIRSASLTPLQRPPIRNSKKETKKLRSTRRPSWIGFVCLIHGPIRFL